MKYSTILGGAVAAAAIAMGGAAAAQDQQFIFEPFSSNNSHEGEFSAGKRLSFAHYIVTEQHQGQLAVTSDIDIGTTFHIQLPLQKEPV